MEKGKRRPRPQGTGKRPKRLAAPRPKSWFERNIKTLLIVFVVLFLGQSIRGCVNTSSLERTVKRNTAVNDSISAIDRKNYVDLQEVLDTSQDENQRLIFELKIAGVRVEEAEKRALAIQSTAEKVKNNNTTTIKIQADTTKTKILTEEIKNEN